ncbi:MAG TPA: phosphate ABC transporter permease PstA [Nocardioides sp.]|jgi:phosphate transport system permease protein|uniref:phosphate ABC transporter permease PstA n=1 Tax=Nocardioides sp. TaxID=35761 RepID=UPI002BAB5BC5|nr:phosphate ABC transporter permease PstA [Nocardioides sp.]HTW17585.1 phosphate ABC transporter permease PstA [Nocardioides sp.]
MTDTQTRVPERLPTAMPLQAAQLPSFAPLLAVVVSGGIGALLALLLGWGPIAAVVVGWIVLVLALPTWSAAVEGRRKSVDRLASVVIWSTFGVALIPLVSLIWQVVSKGIGILSVEFFTYDMRGVLGAGGGIYHALMGTLIITLLATLIAVPIGVLAGVYLVEYGKGNRLARVITFLVDVMTGIPSIVAGLFAFALFTLIFGPATRMGFMGSVALSVLMIPIVVRATEEMLKLVPDELREASYALGVSKWRTIVKVVLPTAFGGIATGVTLAIARVAGETAPLLITVGSTTILNLNPFDGRMATLPVFIYSSVTTGGKYNAEQLDRAWGAALVLVAIVMLLNLLARFIGSIFSPKTGR